MYPDTWKSYHSVWISHPLNEKQLSILSPVKCIWWPHCNFPTFDKKSIIEATPLLCETSVSNWEDTALPIQLSKCNINKLTLENIQIVTPILNDYMRINSITEFIISCPSDIDELNKISWSTLSLLPSLNKLCINLCTDLTLIKLFYEFNEHSFNELHTLELRDVKFDSEHENENEPFIIKKWRPQLPKLNKLFVEFFPRDLSNMEQEKLTCFQSIFNVPSLTSITLFNWTSKMFTQLTLSLLTSNHCIENSNFSVICPISQIRALPISNKFFIPAICDLRIRSISSHSNEISQLDSVFWSCLKFYKSLHTFTIETESLSIERISEIEHLKQLHTINIVYYNIHTTLNAQSFIYDISFLCSKDRFPFQFNSFLSDIIHYSKDVDVHEFDEQLIEQDESLMEQDEIESEHSDNDSDVQMSESDDEM
jgi:hypothetical protein